MRGKWLIATAITALLLGGIGSAGAARLLSGKDIRDRSLKGHDIAKNSIYSSNLSAGLRKAVFSQQSQSLSPGQKGANGAQGEKGDTGAQGPQGPQGPKGDTGPAGKDATGGDAGNWGVIDRNVIGGPAAFVVVAKGFDSFADAMLRKLVQEVASGPSVTDAEER